MLCLIQLLCIPNQLLLYRYKFCLGIGFIFNLVSAFQPLFTFLTMGASSHGHNMRTAYDYLPICIFHKSACTFVNLLHILKSFVRLCRVLGISTWVFLNSSHDCCSLRNSSEAFVDWYIDALLHSGNLLWLKNLRAFCRLYPDHMQTRTLSTFLR